MYSNTNLIALWIIKGAKKGPKIIDVIIVNPASIQDTDLSFPSDAA
jgi:hypothetical protein